MVPRHHVEKVKRKKGKKNDRLCLQKSEAKRKKRHQKRIKKWGLLNRGGGAFCPWERREVNRFRAGRRGGHEAECSQESSLGDGRDSGEKKRLEKTGVARVNTVKWETDVWRISRQGRAVGLNWGGRGWVGRWNAKFEAPDEKSLCVRVRWRAVWRTVGKRNAPGTGQDDKSVELF